MGNATCGSTGFPKGGSPACLLHRISPWRNGRHKPATALQAKPLHVHIVYAVVVVVVVVVVVIVVVVVAAGAAVVVVVAAAAAVVVVVVTPAAAVLAGPSLRGLDSPDVCVGGRTAFSRCLCRGPHGNKFLKLAYRRKPPLSSGSQGNLPIPGAHLV